MANVIEMASLGRPSPYCLEHPFSGPQDFSSIGAALATMEATPVLDAAGLIEIVNRGYCFGTRTLIRGCWRRPAAFRTGESDGSWCSLPQHGDREPKLDVVARQLFERLCRELHSVCQTRRRVGLLLSGGMDSRIVACALRALQSGGLLDCDIVALTWGMEGCRDVEYARRIADMSEWEFRHCPLTADCLERNVQVAGVRGAEYSPVHLHGLPDVAEQSDLELVLAASFGDSVGRAEFSGMHVTNLKPIDRHIYNRFKLLDQTVFKSTREEVLKDAGLYRGKFGARKAKQRDEIDHQLHYMQRMLVPCMEVIGDKIPVYQAFTSPEVYGYMWSLSPCSRNDRVYYEILTRNAPELLRIPWARTGLPYLDSGGTPDTLNKNNNEYGLWLRTVLYKQLKDRVLSDEILRLGVFNMRSLSTLLKYSLRGTNKKASQLQELLIWVASLSEFTGRFEVTATGKSSVSTLGKIVDGRALSLLHAIGFDSKLGIQNHIKRWRG